MRIDDWPEQERPREKLLNHGPSRLSDSELLAIMLRIGVRGQSALELAHDLLTRFGSLGKLCTTPADRLLAHPGVGPAKCAQLLAALELARRAIHSELENRPVLNAPEKVRDFLHLQLGHVPHEVFGVLLLDNQLRLIEFSQPFRGTLNQTAVYPREIVKLALDQGAAAVILAHNHPSGASEPSDNDRTLTRTLKHALSLVDIRVLDHLIITPQGQCTSLAERGLL